MKQTTYRDSQLAVVDSADTTQLEIDGAAAEVSRDPDSRALSSAELPYRTFGSVEELGKAIIDQRRDPDAT